MFFFKLTADQVLVFLSDSELKKVITLGKKERVHAKAKFQYFIILVAKP